MTVTAYKDGIGSWSIKLSIHIGAYVNYTVTSDEYDAEVGDSGEWEGSESVGTGETINDAIVDYLNANEIEAEK